MRKKLILTAVLVLPVIAVSATSILSDDNSSLEKIAFESSGVCLGVDVSGPEFVSSRTARRVSSESKFLRYIFNSNYEAKFFRFSLPIDSLEHEVSLSFQSVYQPSGNFKPRYYGHCSFVEGVGGFQEQIDGGGGCLVNAGHKRVYHSQPGIKGNVRMECMAQQPGNCSMSLTEEIGPTNVRLSISTRDIDPTSWIALSKGLRGLIKKRVSHLENC